MKIVCTTCRWVMLRALTCSGAAGMFRRGICSGGVTCPGALCCTAAVEGERVFQCRRHRILDGRRTLKPFDVLITCGILRWPRLLFTCKVAEGIFESKLCHTVICPREMLMTAATMFTVVPFTWRDTCLLWDFHGTEDYCFRRKMIL